MQRQLRVLCAAIEADAALRLLDEHRQEFAGTSWMPRNFFQRKRIVYILNRIERTYEAFAKVDFDGLPGGALMVKARYKMWLDMRMAQRWQVKDHMRFLDYVSSFLKGARGILERLRRLSITGQIVPSIPSTEQVEPTTNLLD